MADLVIVNKDNFEEEVMKSDIPVLLDFWGPKCGPCIGLMPTVEELAEKYAGKMKFCKVNTAENRRLAITLKVMSLPTFNFYINGELKAQLQGTFGREEIEAQIQEILES